HAMRRNVNLNIVLFNNRIYGLTKGQYSPTSRVGFKTKSSPMGSIDQPLNPVAVALAAEATFVARSLDTHTQHLEMVLQRAAEHQGVSFIEVYQNCVIFNPNEWGELQDRRGRDDHIVYLEHGMPMIFGKDRDKAIRLNGFRPEVVNVADVAEEEILIHDASSKPLALLLSSMEWPQFPAPLGIIRDVVQPDYTSSLLAQVQTAQKQKGVGDLNALYRDADLWTVTERKGVQAQVSGGYSMTLDEEYIDNIDREEPAATSVVQDQLTTTALAALNPNAPISVVAASSLARAVRQMKTHKIGCLLVTDVEDKLIGVFTENDLLRKVVGLVDDLTKATIADYMTADPFTLKSEMPIANAIHLMAVHGFRHVPLIDDDGHPVGIVSFRDVVDYLGQQLR
ncbi:MAG: CBS domain-containing protein, partial [Caldilineaceae bacterium]|nr:CBS domain-containing protein [Caldilineaceae bacterium]